MSAKRNVKVTMNLTEQDVENADKLTKVFNARSKAATISSALSLANEIAKLIKKGEIMIRGKGGDLEKIVFTGMNNG